MSDSEALDFTLRWKEAEAPRRESEHDSVSVGEEESEAAEAVKGEAEDERVLEDDSDGWDAPDDDSPEADGAERFQWTAEREAQLEEAFESIPADAPARVHLQLNDIANGLEDKSLSKERGLVLIGEVEAYLSARIKAEQRKAPVDHAEFMKYREDKLNALYSWQETATALREYCTANEDVQLRVARYAAEQASDFLHHAWDTLQAAEPEPDEAEEPALEDGEAVEEEPSTEVDDVEETAFEEDEYEYDEDLEEDEEEFEDDDFEEDEFDEE